MVEAVILGLAVVAGIDWRRAAMVAAATWVPLPAAVAVGAAAVVGRRLVRSERAGLEVGFAEALVGELRAGSSLRVALGTACSGLPGCEPILRRLRVGEPLDACLRTLDLALPTIGPLVRAAAAAGADGGRLLPTFEEILLHASAANQAREDLRAATAQVRASMWVLVGGPAAYLAWSVGTGRFGRMVSVPGGALLAFVGAVLFGFGIAVMAWIGRRRP